MTQPGMPPYDPNDPYRYGPPAQGRPPYPGQQPYPGQPYPAYPAGGAPMPSTSSGRPNGKQIAKASWAMLKQDRDLLWLPVLSIGTGLVAAAILFVPGFAIGTAVGHQAKIGFYVGGVLAAFALSVVSIYFQAALVIGANMRADGRTPTLGTTLAYAWQMRGRIIAWAVVTTTVGTVIRVVEQRLGVLGKILGFLGGVAWAIATFFAVPVLVAENVGPIEAAKRSAAIIRRTWGTSVRTTVRLGIGYTLLMVPVAFVLVIGVAMIGTNVAVGATLALIGLIGIVIMSAFFSAITTYARTMIYRYAVGRPVPGIPAPLLAGAFAPKRGRR